MKDWEPGLMTPESPWPWVLISTLLGIGVVVNLVLAASIGNGWNLIAGIAAFVIAIPSALYAVVLFMDDGMYR